MQILLVWLVAAVAVLQTSSVNEGVTRSASVMVRRVIDGDTIDVAYSGRNNHNDEKMTLHFQVHAEKTIVQKR